MKERKLLQKILFFVFIALCLVIILIISIIKLSPNFCYFSLIPYLYILFSATFGAAFGASYFILKNKLKLIHFILFIFGNILIIIGIFLLFLFNFFDYKYLFLCCTNFLSCGFGSYLGIYLTKKKVLYL